jgi:hypothetical protein
MVVISGRRKSGCSVRLAWHAWHMQNGSALKRLVEAATIQFRSPLILRSGLAIESGDAVLFAAELHQYRLQLLILRSFRMNSQISATPWDSCCGNYPEIPPAWQITTQLIPLYNAK